GLALAIVLGSVYHRPIIARAVAWLALREGRGAGRVWGESPLLDTLKRYRGFFREGLLDRQYLLEGVPLPGVDPEAAAHWLVFVSYFEANEDRLRPLESSPAVLEEFRLWLEPLAESWWAKEVLANL